MFFFLRTGMDDDDVDRLTREIQGVKDEIRRSRMTKKEIEAEDKERALEQERAEQFIKVSNMEAAEALEGQALPFVGALCMFGCLFFGWQMYEDFQLWQVIGLLFCALFVVAGGISFYANKYDKSHSKEWLND